ncbi:MAG: Ltp family lipoprotein [Bacilli bacterium]
MENVKTKTCKKCKEKIDKKAKKCSHCGSKQRIPIWLIVVIVIIVIVGLSNMGGNDSTSDNNKYNKNKASKVTVADLSTMTETEIDSWCETNKINCTIKTEYSSSIAKDSFISQSINADKTIYEGNKIIIVYSLGAEPTTEQKNALKKAESYSKTMNMSKQGIYNQLTSSIEGFTEDDAQYAINNIVSDWNSNALAKAKSYSKTMNMSKSAIYNQLTSSIEGFTTEEAQYAIDHLDN